MKLPSFDHIISHTAKVWKLFPLEIIVAICGTTVALLLSREPHPFNSEILEKLLIISLIALPSVIAVTISARYGNWPTLHKMLWYGVVGMSLLVFFLAMGWEVGEKDLMRFALFNIAAHLAVAAGPFFKRGTTHGFWQYNKALFLQIVTSAIFSVVLFAGLAGAFAAVKELFKLDVSYVWNARIFIMVAGIFNTIFFLSGVPDSADKPEADEEYPKVLRIFTQYVLVPLVIIYFIILLMYEVRILINWELPNGWVSNLIIAFGIVGILSILLVHPIRNRTDNKWVNAFAKWFFLLMLPLIVLMFVAIGKRISDYGFTEERVFVLATAIWLGIISVYYLWRPSADIRFIPTSLAILALLLNVFAFPISENSQKNRLENLLTKNNLLKDGKAIKNQGTLPANDAESIESIMHYLVKMHGKKSLEPIFNTEALSNKRNNGWGNTNILLDSLNYKTHGNNYGNYLSLDATNEAIQVSDSVLLLKIQNSVDLKSTGYQAIHKNGVLTVYENGIAISPEIKPAEFFAPLAQKYKYEMNVIVPADSLKQIVVTDRWDFTMYYDRLYLDNSANTNQSEYRKMMDIGGLIFARKK